VAGKTVVIVQSSYIPWKGYFDLINLADEFVLYDDVQFTRRDWRNRNRIKTRDGIRWLTIPVQVKGRYLQTVRDTRVSDPGWPRQHWESLRHAYGRAPHFDRYRDWLADLYAAQSSPWLSEINHRFLTEICRMLQIGTSFSWSSAHPAAQGRTERLVAICRAAQAIRYLSGPSARAYLDESLFAQAGISVQYMDYSGYPEYPQLHPPFQHEVSILDLILNVGPEATAYMKSVTAQRSPDSATGGCVVARREDDRQHQASPPSARPLAGT
jgi:hypothetical protein